ncbi:MAG: hypothetical protein GF418_09180 [Chitinivibrionales bacterium]|nr:hypothetical protein [Chitinivibrionales bacterium]MBD3395780.1 hypothetical protein [Chitinivibrionales bacterium]
MKFGIIAAILSLSVHAATYHVSTGGSDANDGSSGSPLATIQAAANLVANGDKVLIQPGAYSEHSIVLENSGIVFESVQRHGAIIDAGGLDAAIITGTADDITLRGLVIRNAVRGMHQGMIHTAAGGWRIEDCVLENVGGEGNAISSYEGPESNADGFVLLRTIMQDNAGLGLEGFGDWNNDARQVNDVPDYTVKDCIFRRNNLAGMNTGYNGAANKLLYTDKTTYDGCISYDNYGNGIWMDFGNRNFSIINCTVFGNHCGVDPNCGDPSGKNCSPNCSGIFSEANPGPGIIKNNVVYRNCIAGINVGESQNITVEDNIAFENGFWDIHIRCCCGDTRDVIHDCIFRNNTVSASSDVKTECAPWAHAPSYNLTWENIMQISSFDIPLITPSCTNTPAGQFADQIQESVTIDDALADAVAGETVTVPVFGRKAIGHEDGVWVTDVYDLNCRYVKLYMDEENMNTVEQAVGQFAVAVPTNLEIELAKKDEYDVRATMGPISVSAVDRAASPLRDPVLIRRAGCVIVRLDSPGSRLEIVTIRGRLVETCSGTGSAVHQLDLSVLAPGTYLLRVVEGARGSATRFCIH